MQSYLILFFFLLRHFSLFVCSSQSLFNLHTMPKGVCCGEKTVLVTVYVERPRTEGRRRIISSSANHNNRHHHHHKRNCGYDKGYDRRAELLHYSHYLREKASTPLLPASSTPIVSHIQQLLTKSVSARRKHKHWRVPSCLRRWKILIPRFRSFLAGSYGRRRKKKHGGNSIATKMKSLINSLKEQRKTGFITKRFSTFRKKRYTFG